ncbi:hypothetical protein [Helicobacter saguini]|uniref:Periplasmic protein n=1 Tax=Helicobacter saguini TaxID=1548018 RepID=A0A6L7D5L9_9HELI|nr:hypothetical protein [Helicobacter saguini]MWV69474.1 hypothetical protein [Helicobacter saguini]
MILLKHIARYITIFILIFSFNVIILTAQDSINMSVQEKIKSLIPPQTYRSNENFIRKIFSDESAFYANKRLDVPKILRTLKANGLMNLKLNKPSNVMVSFKINHFLNSDGEPSFMFLSYATSSLLSSMGYSYFYVTDAKKAQKQLSLTYTLNSESNIDPTLIVDNLSKRGYATLDVKKAAENHYIYDVSLQKSNLTNADSIQKGSRDIVKINGKYWLSLNGVGTLNIASRDNVSWYPKILMFDSNMNVVNAIMLANPTQNYTIRVNDKIQYVMITDNYNPSVLRNGISLSFK